MAVKACPVAKKYVVASAGFPVVVCSGILKSIVKDCAELTQFVPSEVKTFPEVPAVEGYVAVLKIGSAETPFDITT
jgi:hypothetical protein